MESKATGKGIAQNKPDKYISFDHKVEFFKQAELSYFNPELDSDCVKGRLGKRWKFWEQIGANEFILDMIKHGYKLPFISQPTYKNMKNNESAYSNASFVSSTLKDLLKSGSILEVPFEPRVVSPLSVDTRPSGKQRLILDLRHVNKFLLSEHIRFDDWRVFQHFVRPGGFLFKFDLRKGYHHVSIAPEYQTFLGFSWKIEGKKKYFVFTVLPFGLSTAPMVFTKLLRPLVSVWHKQGVKIAVYLDDGAGIDFTEDSTKQASQMTRTLLSDTGFVVNEEKSQWQPSRKMTWLGVELNLFENTYKITQQRISSLLCTIESVLKSPHTTARVLCRLTGKVVSMKFVLSNIIKLKTRSLYKAIDEAASWDGKFNIFNYSDAHKEILFWRDNIDLLNNKSILKSQVKYTIYSDASSSGIGAILKEGSSLNVCHKMFDVREIDRSSTWRELEAIRFGLDSFCHKLSNSSISWLTDNRAAMYVSSSGSNKSHLQDLALSIYELSRNFNINLEVNWVPRDENQIADRVSKIIDPDDWEITEEFLHFLEHRWGNFTVDRFANFDNAKCERFNSKYVVPGTEAVDAFTQDWRFERNLIVPPVSQIPQVLHLLKSQPGIRGVLVIPFWTASSFWPLLREGDEFSYFVNDFVIFDNTSNLLRLGRYKYSLLGSPRYKGRIIALEVIS